MKRKGNLVYSLSNAGLYFCKLTVEVARRIVCGKGQEGGLEMTAEKTIIPKTPPYLPRSQYTIIKLKPRE